MHMQRQFHFRLTVIRDIWAVNNCEMTAAIPWSGGGVGYLPESETTCQCHLASMVVTRRSGRVHASNELAEAT
jgi:hypothetical protein